MGVPGFYKWLVQRYPLIRRRLSDIPKPKIDNLYVDFNCIIYNSLQNVHSAEAPYTILFQEICRFLDVLIQSIRPQCLVFIAIDGPAPFAKCVQQRARRFVSARDYTPGSFDTTQISVGTEFMELLHNYLLNYIKEKTKNDLVWQVPDVIYSSHRSPGEGEHKFFNFIRNNLQNGNITANISHCIYSPDADLLFLGLQTRQPYFYILREYDGWIGPNERVGNGKLDKLKSTDHEFELINLHIARELMQLDYSNVNDVDRVIDDFATFSFLIGNDFIPHFPDVVIQSGQFTNVVQTYQKFILGKKHLVEDGKINKKVLKEFLTNYILTYKDNAKGMTIKSDTEARQYLQQKYPEEYKQNADEFEKKLAHSILDSFDWVFDYYTKGCQSWNWCFPYLYPPPLILVAKHCETHKSAYKMDRPPTPFEQLLSIEPPQSSEHLPQAARSLMFPPSPISYFYPKSFEIDLNGRKFEHDGVVLIPMVNLDQLRNEFAKVEPQLTEDEKIRNTLMNDCLIKRGNVSDYNENEMTLLRERAKNSNVSNFTPSLYDANIQFTYSSENLKVNIFGLDSYSASIALKFAPQAYEVQPPTKASEVKHLLNHPILINWPYLKPALVSAVIDKEYNILPEDLGIKNHDEIDFIFENTVAFYKKKLAIIISDATLLLAVHPIVSTSLNSNRFRFEENPVFVPYILTTSIHKAPSDLMSFFDRKVTPELTVGTTVVINSGNNKGRTGVVASINGNKVTLKLNKKADYSSTFDSLIKDDDKQWEPLDALTAATDIPYEKMVKLLTSIPMEIVNHKEVDVAFTAYSKHKVLDGFCRYFKNEDDDQGFYEVTKEFSQKLNEYIQIPQLSFLLEMLTNPKIKGIGKILLSRILSQEEFQASDQRWTEINQYLKDQPCKKFFLIDDCVETISQMTLKKIEDSLLKQVEEEDVNDDNDDDDDDDNDDDEVTEIVDNLLWPGKPNELKQEFAVGSRVVTLMTSGSIPFGETGTVVAVDRKKLLFSIVLDHEFPHACNLRKRLKTNRGVVAKIDDLLFF